MRVGRYLEMADAAVLFATAAAIFGLPAFAFLCAVLDFRRRSRASFGATARKTGASSANSPGKVILRWPFASISALRKTDPR
jgi:hypothetical protein